MKFPDDVAQSFICDQWWCKTSDKTIEPGRLLWAVVNHVGVLPHRLVTEGRGGPTDHVNAQFKVESFTAQSRPADQKLPIAAFPNYAGESYTVSRGKVRPVLVVASEFDSVEKLLMKRQLKYQIAPAIIVAPYYGVSSGTSVGFKPEFVKRIKQLAYRQYFWDCLPEKGTAAGSILRFDHLQPIGAHHDWYRATDWKLTEEACTFILEYLRWSIFDEPVDELVEIRHALLNET